jgi:hypothetical protein
MGEHTPCALQYSVVFLTLMKSFVIDELRPADYRKLKDYFDENFDSAVIEGIYWLELKPDLYADEQVAHTECQPFYLTLSLEPDRLAAELLVRTKDKMRCSCIAYADKRQRDWLIDQVEAVFTRLQIKT